MPSLDDTNNFTHCQECYSNVHNRYTREYNQCTICLSCRHTLILQAQDGKRDSTSDSHTKQSNKTTTDDYSTSNDKDGDNNDVDNEDLERIFKSKSKTKGSPATISACGNKGQPTIESGEDSEADGWMTATTKKTTPPKTQESKAVVTTPVKELRPFGGWQTSQQLKTSPATNTRKHNKNDTTQMATNKTQPV